jgi:hypothetical protein
VSLQGQAVARSACDTPWDDSLMPPLFTHDAPHYVRVYAECADAVMSTVVGIPYDEPAIRCVYALTENCCLWLSFSGATVTLPWDKWTLPAGPQW